MRIEGSAKMRAEVDGINAGFFPLKIFFHSVMKPAELIFIDKAPGNTGLVGDDDG